MTAESPTPMPTPRALDAPSLRWRCNPEDFPFTDTRDVEPVVGVIGQDPAVESLRFGLECTAHGQNVYVKGLTGTGRMTLLRRLLEEIKPTCPPGRDRCYVHNFDDPTSPRLISLPRGSARRFERLVTELADFIRDELGEALSSETMSQRIAALKNAAQEQVSTLAEPLEKDAAEAGLALVTVVAGNIARPAIFPKVDDKPVTLEQYEAMRQEGTVSEDDYQAFHSKREQFDDKLDELNLRILEAARAHHEAVREIVQTETRTLLTNFTSRILDAFTQQDVRTFLDQVVRDVVDNRFDADSEDAGDFTRAYRVNVICTRAADSGCPTIIENVPTYANLVGTIDRAIVDDEIRPADHMSISAGSLLQADGGFLVIDARDVLSEPGAWKALVRTLRSGKLEISPFENIVFGRLNLLKPEPIDVQVKVVLVGDSYLYAMLDGLDPDFPNLFKVLAEFDTTIENTEASRGHYARVIARIIDEDTLLPFTREAVAALTEHGARVASSRDKLTTRFSRLADIAREAAFIAKKRGADMVSDSDVRETVKRTKRRADLRSRKFREMLADGVIQVQMSGRAIGQINGLAVSQAGPLTYGFPARITATIGAGSSGVINIERESELSGAIHTKGVFILEGLLRTLLPTEHPLAFNASIAFEQSYGGIDGDSASGAEVCCLLSALTRCPLRQDLAMTGAIDQHGAIMAIGGVNEKIEGFFDVCADAGLTGTQGVIIPKSNADDLMLRTDVVDAAAEGTFSIYPVSHVTEALALFTDRAVGELDDAGRYPPGTLLYDAMEHASRYWRTLAQARLGESS